MSTAEAALLASAMDAIAGKSDDGSFPYWLVTFEREDGGTTFAAVMEGSHGPTGPRRTFAPSTPAAGSRVVGVAGRAAPVWEFVGVLDSASIEPDRRLADHLRSGGVLTTTYLDRRYDLRRRAYRGLGILELRCTHSPGRCHRFAYPVSDEADLLDYVSHELIGHDGLMERILAEDADRANLRRATSSASATGRSFSATGRSTGTPRSLGEILVREMKGAMDSYVLAVSERDLARHLEEVVRRETGTRLLGYIKPEGVRNDTTTSFVTPEDLEPVPMWWARGVFTVPVYGTGEPIGAGVSPASTPTSDSETSIEVDSETSTDTSATPSS